MYYYINAFFILTIFFTFVKLILIKELGKYNIFESTLKRVRITFENQMLLIYNNFKKILLRPNYRTFKHTISYGFQLSICVLR